MLKSFSRPTSYTISWAGFGLPLLLPAFLLPGWWSWPALVLALALVVSRHIALNSPFPKTILDWPIGLTLLSLLIGLYASLDATLSANRAWSLLGGIISFYGVNAFLSSRQVVRWGGPVLVSLGVLVGLVSLVGTDWGRGDLLKIPLIYDQLPHLLNSSFGSGASSEQELNPRVIAGAMAMLVPVAWCTALAAPRRQRVVGLIAALFLSFILLLTQSPSGIGGVLVAFAVFGLAWLGWRYRYLLLIYALGLATLGFALGPLLQQVGQRLPLPTTEPTQRLVFRLEMWLRALDMLRDKPFTGIGLNNFPTNLSHFYPTYSLGPEAHAHNLLLQTALDGGLVGLAAFFGVLAGVFLTLSWAYRANIKGRTLIIGIGLGTLSWFLYGSIEALTLGHKPAVLLWLMWGGGVILARDYRPKKPENSFLKRENSLPLKAFILGVVVISLIVVVATCSTSLLAQFNLNLAILEGQKAVLQNDTEGALQARNRLETSLSTATSASVNLPSAATLNLLAQLSAQSQDFEAARSYLAQEVALDKFQTQAKYIPSDWQIWRQSPPGTNPPASSVVRLYRQWQLRYPSDAISYARLAAAYSASCDFINANASLTEGYNRTSSLFLAYLLNKEPPKQTTIYCKNSDLLGLK